MPDREKLIELLSQDKAYPDCDKCKTPVGHCNRCVLEIHADHLISHGVTVRERGRWEEKHEIKSFKHTNIPVVQCSKCEVYFCDIINNHHYMYHYCPNCGADMRGEEDG